ncbi:MAG: peptidylprolyl isomerase [Bacteroidetes bacterium]|nr:peptidylprolyl isomerase [Bacteroidota bacterium]
MVGRLSIIIILFGIGGSCLQAQPVESPQIVDEIVAIVGDNYILRSDIEKEIETLREQMGKEFVHDSLRMEILDQLIAKKLLLYKAQIDSVEISDDMVDSKIEERLNYILSHFGGDERALEKYLKMTIPEFKAKTRPKIKEQLLIQQMQSQIIKEVKVSPAEVRNYFRDISKDSLPPVPEEVEVAQIIIAPQVSDFAWDYAKEVATNLRERLVQGANFCVLAHTYSDDPGSSGKCGELGFFKRGKMVPEFEAAAFSLEKDSLSKIIRSQYGYHIIQLLDRRGESVSVRHILIAPEMLETDLADARNRLDSIRSEILAGTISFKEAAVKYSSDEYSSGKGGLLMDYSSGETKIPVGNLEKEVFLRIKDLKPGEVSQVYVTRGQDGKEMYIIYNLISESPPHRPSLETDYLKIQNAALEQKKATALEDWMDKNKTQYYIHISERYSNAPELAHWKKDK